MIDSNANGSALPNLPVSRLATDSRFHLAYISFYTAVNVITLLSEKWNDEYSDANNDLIVSTYAPLILYAVKFLYEICWIRGESEIARVLFESTSMAPLLYMCLHIQLARSPDDPSARDIGHELTVSIASWDYFIIFVTSLHKFCDITQPQILKTHKLTMFAWFVLFLCTLSGGLAVPAAAQPFLVLAVLTIMAGQWKAYFDFLDSQRTHQNEPPESGEVASHYAQLFAQNESAAGGGDEPHNTQMNSVVVAIAADDNGEDYPLAQRLEQPLMQNGA